MEETLFIFGELLDHAYDDIYNMNNCMCSFESKYCKKHSSFSYNYYYEKYKTPEYLTIDLEVAKIQTSYYTKGNNYYVSYLFLNKNGEYLGEKIKEIAYKKYPEGPKLAPDHPMFTKELTFNKNNFGHRMASMVIPLGRLNAIPNIPKESLTVDLLARKHLFGKIPYQMSSTYFAGDMSTAVGDFKALTSKDLIDFFLFNSKSPPEWDDGFRDDRAEYYDDESSQFSYLMKVDVISDKVDFSKSEFEEFRLLSKNKVCYVETIIVQMTKLHMIWPQQFEGDVINYRFCTTTAIPSLSIPRNFDIKLHETIHFVIKRFVQVDHERDYIDNCEIATPGYIALVCRGSYDAFYGVFERCIQIYSQGGNEPFKNFFSTYEHFATSISEKEQHIDARLVSVLKKKGSMYIQDNDVFFLGKKDRYEPIRAIFIKPAVLINEHRLDFEAKFMYIFLKTMEYKLPWNIGIVYIDNRNFNASGHRGTPDANLYAPERRRADYSMRRNYAESTYEKRIIRHLTHSVMTTPNNNYIYYPQGIQGIPLYMNSNGKLEYIRYSSGKQIEVRNIFDYSKCFFYPLSDDCKDNDVPVRFIGKKDIPLNTVHPMIALDPLFYPIDSRDIKYIFIKCADTFHVDREVNDKYSKIITNIQREAIENHYYDELSKNRPEPKTSPFIYD